MKQLKRIAAAALAAAALAVTIGAGSASATTLEVRGVTQNGSVDVEFRVALGSSTVLSRTDGSLANTCTTSRMRGKTESGFTTTPTGALSTLTFESCTRPVTVHQKGKLYVEHRLGTDGTVFSEEAEVTVSTAFGTVNCKTGSGTDIGTLTGVSSGWSTLHVNAVLNCGFLLPSATWKGFYEETWAEGLGVSA